MDLEMMQTEVLLTEFVDFYKQATEATNGQAPEAERIPTEVINGMVSSLNIMKTLFVAQRTVQKLIADATGQEQ